MPATTITLELIKENQVVKALLTVNPFHRISETIESLAPILRTSHTRCTLSAPAGTEQPLALDTRWKDVIDKTVRPMAHTLRVYTGVDETRDTPGETVAAATVDDRTPMTPEEQRAAAFALVAELDELVSRMIEIGDPGDGSSYFLELCDANGEAVALSPVDQKALTLGMLLHSKGAVALQQEEGPHYARVLLEEAEKALTEASDPIVTATDTLAVLYIDLVWALQAAHAATEHPSADAGAELALAMEKLTFAEALLHKHYGHGLSRLPAGDPKRVTYARLHVLQALALWHAGDTVEALIVAQQAAGELDALTPDAGAMVRLQAMGFSATEARCALRSAANDESAAVAWVVREREREHAETQEAEARARDDQRRSRYGRTRDGAWVDLAILDRLCAETQASEQLCAFALAQANNDPDQAVCAIVELASTWVDPDPVADSTTAMDTATDTTAVESELQAFNRRVRQVIDRDTIAMHRMILESTLVEERALLRECFQQMHQQRQRERGDNA